MLTSSLAKQQKQVPPGGPYTHSLCCWYLGEMACPSEDVCYDSKRATLSRLLHFLNDQHQLGLHMSIRRHFGMPPFTIGRAYLMSTEQCSLAVSGARVQYLDPGCQHGWSLYVHPWQTFPPSCHPGTGHRLSALTDPSPVYPMDGSSLPMDAQDYCYGERTWDNAPNNLS